MATIGEWLALIITASSVIGIVTGVIIKDYKRNSQVDENSKDIDCIKGKMQEVNSVQELMIQAHLAILHDRLYCICEHYIHKEVVDTDDLHNLEHLYKAYSALGGNGTAEELYKRVLKLKIKKEIT